METLLANLTGKVRRETLNGREYLVAPLTSIVPGVLAGSAGALMYFPQDVGENVQSWDGMPLTLYHPTSNGRPASARNPKVMATQAIGTVYDSVFNDKLQHEGWFDELLTKAADKRFGVDVHGRLLRGEPIELSTGLYTVNEPAPPGSHHNGKPYDFIARNFRPDHIAVLPDQRGACAISDGCGVLVNKGDVINANPEGCNQFKPCDSGGAAPNADALKASTKARAASKDAHAVSDSLAAWAGEGEQPDEYTFPASSAGKNSAAAVRLGRNGEHAAAAEYHKQAAYEHQNAAEGHRGYAGNDLRHEEAAKAHEKAAKLHMAAARKHETPVGNVLANQLEPGDECPECGYSLSEREVEEGFCENCGFELDLVGNSGEGKRGIVRRFLDWLTRNANPEGCNQYKACEGGADPKEQAREMKGHPLAGKTDQEKIADHARTGNSGGGVNPRGYDFKNFPKGVDGAKLTEDVVKTVEAAQAKNSFLRPNIRDVYDTVKGDHQGLTLHDFQASLAKMMSDKKVRLDPYTGAKSTIPDLDAAFPLDRETKFYIDKAHVRNAAHPGAPVDDYLLRSRLHAALGLSGEDGVDDASDSHVVYRQGGKALRRSVTIDGENITLGDDTAEVVKVDAHHRRVPARGAPPTDRQTALAADAATQKATTGHNPPNWAVDEALWEKAKAAADKSYDEGDDAYWPAVVSIYEKMGGEVKGKTENSNPEGCNQHTGPGCGGGSGGSLHEHIEAHAKELVARTERDGKEHGAVFNKAGEKLWEGSGEVDELAIPSSLGNHPDLIVIHTHPTDVSFTPGDWVSALRNPNATFAAESPSASYRLHRENSAESIKAKAASLSDEDINNKWWQHAREFVRSKEGQALKSRERVEKANHYASGKLAEEFGFSYEERKRSAIRNINRGDTANQEDTDMNRDATIGWLVANCDCWKGKQPVLANKDAFTDAELARLKAQAEKASQDASLANATRKGLGERLVANATADETAAMLEKCKKLMEAEAKEPAINATPAPAASRLTPEEQEDLAFARQEKNRLKSSLVERLTANVADPVQKTATVKWLAGKGLDELHNLVALLPPTTNQDTGPPLPLYYGAAGAPAAQPAKDDSDNLLPVVTLNFEDMASPALRKKA